MVISKFNFHFGKVLFRIVLTGDPNENTFPFKFLLDKMIVFYGYLAGILF
ncbi:hypothetical protein LEP1GSC125_2543 [Leptospira mayottensis 200901122]|uniref:Uncharacterized protein n=1 Tax=Leptospira mayottensis 200901122 TaxID=1193010 RepID=A0AA87SWS3_9LEPT|nr:hypothetical protein LEP1GSC125_2543 [Leptospira mayottensis 200901122]